MIQLVSASGSFPRFSPLKPDARRAVNNHLVTWAHVQPWLETLMDTLAERYKLPNLCLALNFAHKHLQTLQLIKLVDVAGLLWTTSSLSRMF